MNSRQTVTLFHINDLHRRLHPFPDGKGGADRLVGEIRRREQEHPDALTISVGDLAGDNTVHGPDYFEPLPALLNRAGVDIQVLGNHEFEDSTDGYASLERGLIAPFQGQTLVANVSHQDGRPIAGTQPYTVRQLQDQAIAVIGVVTRDLSSAMFGAAGAALATLPIEDTLRQLVQQARAEGAQGVVVAAHESLSKARQIALEVPGIDLVLAAHDHRATERPERLVREDGSQVWVAQSEPYGRAVGQADLIFENGRVVDIQGQLHPVDQNSPSDPEALALREGYQARPRATKPAPKKSATTLTSFADLAQHMATQKEGTLP